MTKLSDTGNHRNNTKIDMIGNGSKKGKMAQKALAEQTATESEVPPLSLIDKAWHNCNDPKRRREMFNTAKAAALAAANPAP